MQQPEAAPSNKKPVRPIVLPADLTPVQAPESFLDDAAELGIEFDTNEVEQFGRFLAALRALNELMNLTRIVDDESMWSRHILDSLTLLPIIASVETNCLIDVGSGAGLPGLPLAIALPQVQCTLLEATGKKARAIACMVEYLQLDNVDVANERAETAGRDQENHRAVYDIVTARAVGPLPVLLELTIPLAREGGLVLAIKGDRAAEEIAASREALHRLHALVIDQVRTPTGTIIVIEKQRRTPKMYPRRPGEPKRAPLGGIVQDKNDVSEGADSKKQTPETNDGR